jgi:DNA-binding PucR family transcriptional regulator
MASTVLSHALAGLIETLQAADRMVRVGWIEDTDDLAVERLLLLDESLLTTIVRRELGPLLAEPRMGVEFVETLAGLLRGRREHARGARRLHLAPRTVAYRLERIEELLGRPIDGESRARLSVALMAYRALGERSASA